MSKQAVAQWLRCYKSYWFNLSIFIAAIMLSTLVLNKAIHDYIDSAIGFFTVDITGMCAILIIAFAQFKQYKEKDRYITFLHVKKLLDKERFDQR